MCEVYAAVYNIYLLGNFMRNPVKHVPPVIKNRQNTPSGGSRACPCFLRYCFLVWRIPISRIDVGMGGSAGWQVRVFDSYTYIVVHLIYLVFIIRDQKFLIHTNNMTYLHFNVRFGYPV